MEKIKKYIDGAGNQIVDFGTLTLEEIAQSSTSYRAYQVIELIESGAPELVADFEKIRKNTTLTVPVLAEVTNYDLSGDFVDVGRFLGGEPECMVNFTSYGETKFLTLNIGIGRPGLTTDEEYFTYFASVVNLIDSLENSGYRVQVVGLFHAVSAKKEFLAQVPVKRFQDPVNFSELVLLASNLLFTEGLIRRKGYESAIGNCRCVDAYPKRAPKQSDTEMYIPSMYGFAEEGRNFYRHSAHELTFEYLMRSWGVEKYLN